MGTVAAIENYMLHVPLTAQPASIFRHHTAGLLGQWHIVRCRGNEPGGALRGGIVPFPHLISRHVEAPLHHPFDWPSTSLVPASR